MTRNDMDIPVPKTPPYATYISNRREKMKYHSGIGHAKVALQSCLTIWERRNSWLKAHGQEIPFPTLELYKYQESQGHGHPPGYVTVLTVQPGMTVNQLKEELENYT